MTGKVRQHALVLTQHLPSHCPCYNKPHLSSILVTAVAFTTDGTTVPVRFQAVGSAPILSQKVFKVSASQKFETVVNFLRKKLQCKPTDSVFLYVNSIFAPGLDEGVGNLYRVS